MSGNVILQRLVAALIASALILSSCAPDREPDGRSGSALKPTFAGHRVFGGNVSATVDVYSAEIFEASEPVTLINAAPSEIDESLELLATRVAFIRAPRTRHKHITGQPPAIICTDKWPPAGFGPTFDIEGLSVEAGEKFGVIFYVRSLEDRGKWSASGIEIRYRIGSQVFTQSSDGASIEMQRAPTLEQLPSDLPVCDVDAWTRSEWFQVVVGFEAA